MKKTLLPYVLLIIIALFALFVFVASANLQIAAITLACAVTAYVLAFLGLIVVLEYPGILRQPLTWKWLTPLRRGALTLQPAPEVFRSGVSWNIPPLELKDPPRDHVAQPHFTKPPNS